VADIAARTTLYSPTFFALLMKKLETSSIDFSTTTLLELVELLRQQSTAQSGLEHMLSKLLSTALSGVWAVALTEFAAR